MLRGIVRIYACALAIGAVFVVEPRAAAQEEAAAGFPYFYVVSAEVKPGAAGSYQQALDAIVKANRESSSGISFATYQGITGSLNHYHHFIGLQSLGDMDAWKTLPEILAEVHGQAKAGEVMQTLAESTANTETRILAYQPDLSNPGEGVIAPPTFVQHVAISVHPGHETHFQQLAAKYLPLAREHEQALDTLSYTNMIGGVGTEMHFFAGLDAMGDLDGAASPPEIMAEAWGPQEAQKFMNEMAEAATLSIHYMAFVPAMSNVPQM